MAKLSEDGFVRLREILGDRRRGVPGLIPIGKSAWYNGIADGRFPKPVRLGPRTTAWRVSDIRELIERLSQTQAGKAEK